MLNQSSKNTLQFLIGGDFTVLCISFYLYINRLGMILMNLILICLQFVLCNLLFIPWKNSSKDTTGTHWSRASTPKRKDIMVCSSEKCIVLVFFISGDSQSSGVWVIGTFIEKLTLAELIFPCLLYFLFLNEKWKLWESKDIFLIGYNSKFGNVLAKALNIFSSPSFDESFVIKEHKHQLAYIRGVLFVYSVVLVLGIALLWILLPDRFSTF